MRTRFILALITLIIFSVANSYGQIIKTISWLDKPIIGIDTVKRFYPTLMTSASQSTSLVYDGTDLRVFPSANEQSEVNISICRNNPSNLIISTNTYTTVAEQGYYVSNNYGNSWTGGDALLHSTTVWGDPSTAFDANGYIYLSTITDGGDGYFVQRSTDKGVTWSNLIRGITAANFDKEMIAVDDQAGSPYLNSFYCAWSIINGLNSTVNFNRSTDGLQHFSQPITLKNGCGQGANVQIGINGEVYVCWADFSTCNYPANGIGFVLSTDGGTTFSASRVAFAISGIANSGTGNPLFNNIRVNDFPSMAIDKSNSTHRGRIYVTYPTKENGNGKAVIQVRFSDDRGTTWSTGKTISISNGLQNFFPWISVDPLTGIISVTYYSFDSISGFSTNTYVAYSFDGGTTYTNQKVSDVSHITAPINNTIHRPGYAGDYIGITSFGSVAYPAWMDNRNGTWQVYVSPITYMYITGPTLVCSSNATFTINNLPIGDTVTWSHQGPYLTYVSGQFTNSYTVHANGNGPDAVQATIKGVSGSITLQYYPVWAGIPQIGTGSTYTNKGSTYPLLEIPNVPVSFDSTLITNESLSPNTTWLNNACYLWWVNTTMQLQGQSSVTWTKVTSTPSDITWSQNGNDLKFYFYSLNQTATFNISTSNSCGNVVNGYNFAAINCGSGCTMDYTLSPNPASTTLSIIPYIPPPCGSVLTNPQILQVTFYDTQGNPKKIFAFGKGTSQVQIDISSLNIGTYILDIYDGTTSVRKMLMIQR